MEEAPENNIDFDALFVEALERGEKARKLYADAIAIEKTNPLEAVKLLYQANCFRALMEPWDRLYNAWTLKKETALSDAQIESLLEQHKNCSPKELFYFGLQALSGIGGPCNNHLARLYFERSAQGNFAPAIHQLGALYFYKRRGIEKDTVKGLAYYQKAAATETGCGLAEIDLAREFFYGGSIIKQNLDEAEKLARGAAGQGNAQGYYTLGELKEKAGNKAEAASWFRCAAAQGYQDAKEQLEKMYGSSVIPCRVDDVAIYRRDYHVLSIQNARNYLERLAQTNFSARFELAKIIYGLGVTTIQEQETLMAMLNTIPDDNEDRETYTQAQTLLSNIHLSSDPNGYLWRYHHTNSHAVSSAEIQDTNTSGMDKDGVEYCQTEIKYSKSEFKLWLEKTLTLDENKLSANNLHEFRFRLAKLNHEEPKKLSADKISETITWLRNIPKAHARFKETTGLLKQYEVLLKAANAKSTPFWSSKPGNGGNPPPAPKKPFTIQ